MSAKSSPTMSHGAVVRGRRDRRELALVFTGGDFGEGSQQVLDALATAGISGAFFFTGDYLRQPVHHSIVTRAVTEGHYVGPHSDAHLLYCPWDDRERTLVSRQEFSADLRRNVAQLVVLGVPEGGISWWIPPYEWFNAEVAGWAREEGFPLFSFTPGTLSHADYTEDSAPNYRSSEVILQSIWAYEQTDPLGLNGFLLLSHVGAGPVRTDKFFLRLPELIEGLRARGYGFIRADRVLAG
jgi:peptidoglycan/xylan/chitin deacetylase (PgdA/CDA1 family)